MILTLIPLIPIASVETLASEGTSIPSISAINNVSYFIEFDPKHYGRSTTDYLITFEHDVDGLNLAVKYDNPGMTYKDSNFNYNGSFLDNGTFMIDYVSQSFYSDYMSHQSLELFANTTNPNDQRWRLDEFLIWQDFIYDDLRLSVEFSTNRSFTYEGSDQYGRNLVKTFDVHKYKTEFSFLGSGCV